MESIMGISRRLFIQRASAASAIPLILPSSVWGAAVKPNDKMGMGFIGMGKQSQMLLNYFVNQDSVKVLAVCDVDTNRR